MSEEIEDEPKDAKPLFAFVDEECVESEWCFRQISGDSIIGSGRVSMAVCQDNKVAFFACIGIWDDKTSVFSFPLTASQFALAIWKLKSEGEEAISTYLRSISGYDKQEGK